MPFSLALLMGLCPSVVRGSKVSEPQNEQQNDHPWHPEFTRKLISSTNVALFCQSNITYRTNIVDVPGHQLGQGASGSRIQPHLGAYSHNIYNPLVMNSPRSSPAASKGSFDY